MEDGTESADAAILPGGWPAWLGCVAFAVFPLGLFLAGIETFTTGAVGLEPLFDAESWDGKRVLSPLAAGFGDISFFRYAVYVFVHVLICLVVGLHFLSRLSASRRRVRVALFALGFAAIVIAVVFAVTIEGTAFRGYMVDPLAAVLAQAEVRIPALGPEILGPEVLALGGGIDSFLALALVIPTGLGIVVVVFATCSFHATLFFRRADTTATRQDVLDRIATMLRRDLIALSIVLVSAVMTARSYFSIPADVFDSGDHGAAVFYQTLAQALSTGAGLLFSATLFAAFAPGFVVMTVQSNRGQGRDRSSLWSGLSIDLDWASHRFTGIWKTVAAFAAPAISAPLVDLVAGFAG